MFSLSAYPLIAALLKLYIWAKKSLFDMFSLVRFVVRVALEWDSSSDAGLADPDSSLKKCLKIKSKSPPLSQCLSSLIIKAHISSVASFLAKISITFTSIPVAFDILKMSYLANSSNVIALVITGPVILVGQLRNPLIFCRFFTIFLIIFIIITIRLPLDPDPDFPDYKIIIIITKTLIEPRIRIQT